MSGFKTKRIPNQPKRPIADMPSHQEEDKTIIEVHPNKKGFFSRKLLLLLVLLGTTIFFFTKVGIEAFKGNEKNGSENVSLPTIIKEFQTQKVEGTTNILIAGIGGKGHDGSDLTDSIMLASLDKGKKQVTLMSLPRDLYVAFPEKYAAGRINALYDIGKRENVGIQYLAAKVSEITGQTIDHYLVIDFAGFKKVVDLLGGIAIEVPEDLTDREYPDENWGYEIFSVKKGPQIFDGDTALKYARSRHSTSDFDRSERQQLILKSIKEKASDLGIISDFSKFSEIYNAILSNVDTDLSLAKLSEIALSFSDVKSEDMSIVTLSDVCLSLTKCQPGSFLYAPSRELFGGSAVIIPENAYAQRLSYYVDIRRFVDLTFRFPDLRSQTRNIVFIYDPSMKKRAQEISLGLAKLGFPLSFEKTISASTGTLEKSHINFYWHDGLEVGINPKSSTIEGLKYLEGGIPFTSVERNEFIHSSGPMVEIVIGKDGDEYFKDLHFPSYLPQVPKSTVSGESSGSTTGSTQTNTTKPANKSITHDAPKRPTLSSEASSIKYGWENF